MAKTIIIILSLIVAIGLFAWMYAVAYKRGYRAGIKAGVNSGSDYMLQQIKDFYLYGNNTKPFHQFIEWMKLNMGKEEKKEEQSV